MWKNEIKLCEAPVFGENRKGSNKHYGMKEPNLRKGKIRLTRCPALSLNQLIAQVSELEQETECRLR